LRIPSIVVLPLTVLALGPVIAGQGRASHQPGVRVEHGPSVTHVFEGIVLGADGAPADGALVESSAGGRATTDLGGFFRLEVRVPTEVESVQLTATARDCASDVSIVAPVAPGATFVEPLVLDPSPRCRLGWLPAAPRLPGVEASIHALAVFDDGSGPVLYAGGGICSQAGNRLASWNGTSWTPVDSEMDGTILSLAVFDDGTGPALYAGGNFTIVEGVPARRIAKWDGSHWSALGSGTATFGALVRALAVFDDGSGPAL
jgi:hypothetical protein